MYTLLCSIHHDTEPFVVVVNLAWQKWTRSLPVHLSLELASEPPTTTDHGETIAAVLVPVHTGRVAKTLETLKLDFLPLSRL